MDAVAGTCLLGAGTQEPQAGLLTSPKLHSEFPLTRFLQTSGAYNQQVRARLDTALPGYSLLTENEQRQENWATSRGKEWVRMLWRLPEPLGAG